MRTGKSAWRTWTPTTAEDKEAVGRELRAISASPHFCNSKRYPALISYVVEHTLEGRADELKERTLGVEVFQRPADYDTQSDTIVRYTAGEVRKRLSLYYHERDWDTNSESKIQISLPPGSYVPEFFYAMSFDEDNAPGLSAASGNLTSHHLQTSQSAMLEVPPVPNELFAPVEWVAGQEASSIRKRWHWMSGMMVILAVASIFSYYYSNDRPESAVTRFWSPVLTQHTPVLLCTGSVVFDQNKITGTATAGKDAAYPFVSLQQADAIGLMSALLDRGGAPHLLQSAASTPLSDLRERPVILLGGYNNDWTFRLQDQLRFQFLPEPQHAIADVTHPGVVWSRDLSKPYSNSDDYAIIARFHDATADSTIVILAGIGRNGTEAAAQFVTSPHYMQELAERAGKDMKGKNVEAVIKVNVIEGKTGAPAIEAIYVW